MDSTFRNTVLDSFPGTIIVNYHFIAPFNNEQTDSLYAQYPYTQELNAFPNGLGFSLDSPDITHTVDSLYGISTPVNIEIITKTWNADTNMVDLGFTLTNNGPELPGSYWYNIIITEDSRISGHTTQTGCSTSDTGAFNYKFHYLNNWVGRKLVFGVQGTSLIENTWPAHNTITKDISFSLDTSWIAENCNITVHVYQKEDSLYKSPTMQAIQIPVIGWTDIPEQKPLAVGIIGIFPNPAKDIANIHISIEDKSYCLLHLFNSNGQLIKTLNCGKRSPGLYNVEFQTNSIPSGTYIVVLETDTGRTSEKLIIR